MSPSITMKISSVLWVIWGLVHVLAGVLTISNDATGAVQGISDAVDPAALVADYHPAVEAVLHQHGWNLGWIGLTTIICAVFIWRKNFQAAALAALVGGLADVGYFLFMDLGGFVHFLPGTLMTIFSGSAILLSLWAYKANPATS